MSKRSRLRAIFCALAAVTASMALAGTAGASGGGVVIQAQDACDPATFGPLCERSGESGKRVSFDRAIAELGTKGSIGGWRFSPDKVNVHVGESVQAAIGRGGEGHTWTDVTTVGFQDRGCIAEINAAIFQGDDSVSPICGPVIPEAGVPVLILQTFLPPDAPATVDTSHAGTQLFQCVIHPWMHATVSVR